ncbi:MAG: sugar phosphate isomerase/epimerase, partial [Pseudomonadota bacterium]
MQELRVYQSLWAMEQRRPGVKEKPLEEQFEEIRSAGFTGVCIDPSVAEIDGYGEVGSLCERFGMGCMVNAFPYKVNELLPILEFAKSLNACLVNVIGGVMPLTVAGAIPVIYRWMEEAESMGLPLLFETHRDSLLNDLFFTLQLLDEVPDLRLCADLSHFVVDRELRIPLNQRDQGFMDRVLCSSDCFQGRVANREQVQVQIDFPQHLEWVETFKAWWRTGIQGWRERSGPDDTLYFLCELGPPPYAITDAERNELSNRFQEALTIKS